MNTAALLHFLIRLCQPRNNSTARAPVCFAFRLKSATTWPRDPSPLLLFLSAFDRTVIPSEQQAAALICTCCMYVDANSLVLNTGLQLAIASVGCRTRLKEPWAELVMGKRGTADTGLWAQAGLEPNVRACWIASACLRSP